MVLIWVLLAVGVIVLVGVVADVARHARRLAGARTAAAEAMAVRTSTLRAEIAHRRPRGRGAGGGPRRVGTS